MSGIYNADILPVPTLEALENVSAQFRALFLVEHNEDGSHRASPEVTNFVPPGAVIPYAGTTAPDHWLMCDGNQINRIAYKRLFDIIGTTYGSGDGSTTFNIPDLRQRFILGKSASGTGVTLGSTGGTIDHDHSFGSHTHSISSVSDHTHTGPSHTHGSGSYTTPSHSHGGVTGTGSNETEINVGVTAPYDIQHVDHTHTISTQAAMAITGTSGSGGTGATSADGGHNHGGTTGAASAGTSGTGNPPYITLNHIIKT